MSFVVGFLVFPKITQLDMTGPFEVMARIPGAEIHLLWKNRTPVQSDSGLTLTPTTPSPIAPLSIFYAYPAVPESAHCSRMAKCSTSCVSKVNTCSS